MRRFIDMTGKLILRLIKGFNGICMMLIYHFITICFLQEQFAMKGFSIEIWHMSFLFLLLYCIFGKIYDAFLVSLVRISELIYSQMLAFILSDFILYLVSCLILNHIVRIHFLLLEIILQLVFSVVWCFLVHHWYFHFYPPKKTMVVYGISEGMEDLIQEYGLDIKFDVQKVISSEELRRDLSLIEDYNTIFMSGVESGERNVILKHSILCRKNMYIIPKIGDVIMRGAKNTHLFHLPMMNVTYYNPSPFYLCAKRCFDILLSVMALICLSPVFLVTACLIKVTDSGPVFYKQERMTQNGRKFMIHKFRSMRVDAEKDGIARLSSGENDDRITAVGRVIRKLRIDELPQLIDILKGDLSIVGPRPEREEIAAQYEEVLPEFHLRLQAKAGLTGYAQVYGKYNSTPYDKLMMDLMYISHPSLLEDLRICFATLKILFMPESTEGVAAGQTIAMERNVESLPETDREDETDADRENAIEAEEKCDRSEKIGGNP